MELHFGKPYANFYIDDLAINPYTDSFEKETGIYDINIEPRSFNSVEYFDDFIIKKSNNIDGELFYYKNIPNELINLFPKLITFTDCTITLEKIKGINISYLYSNKLLTIDNLNIILKNIEKIHNHNNCCEILNIYDNYEKKLTKRYLDYDYGLIDNSEKMY